MHFLNLTDVWVIPGSLWSLVGAMLYAVYIVMIKRRVDREDKLDIPMFFGEETLSIDTSCSVLAHEVVGIVTDRRFLLFRVCGPVQPAVSLARLPPAPLHGLRGL